MEEDSQDGKSKVIREYLEYECQLVKVNNDRMKAVRKRERSGEEIEKEGEEVETPDTEENTAQEK